MVQIYNRGYIFTGVYIVYINEALKVIFNWICSTFHIWIASIKLSFKFEYSFFSVEQSARRA